MRRPILLAAAGLAVAVVAALLVVGGPDGDRPGPEPPTPGGPADGGGGHEAAVIARPATLLQAVVPRWTPGGRAITDEWGENEEILEPGREVSVLGGPVSNGLESWVRVYVLPSRTVYPGDFYAWLPAAVDGRPVLDVGPPVGCPGELTLASLGVLAPLDRFRCAGGNELVLEGLVGFAGDYVAYRVEPAWFGTGVDGSSAVSLMPTFDAQVAPGLEVPPVGYQVRAIGQFGHPAAETCRRTVERTVQPPPPPGSGLPDERPEDSVAWCRARFVITAWTATVGPEGRPVEAGDVQLHRSAGGLACSGVGMPPLRFRIDASATDPIWLEAAGSDRRIVPLFSDAFRVVTDPELAVADATGVVIRDGTPVNPDADFHGHAVCPMGYRVSFD